MVEMAFQMTPKAGFDEKAIKRIEMVSKDRKLLQIVYLHLLSKAREETLLCLSDAEPNVVSVMVRLFLHAPFDGWGVLITRKTCVRFGNKLCSIDRNGSRYAEGQKYNNNAEGLLLRIYPTRSPAIELVLLRVVVVSLSVDVGHVVGQTPQ
jgi:hypothetical protein